MDWALKFNREHVRAGTQDALTGQPLRCPECGAAVYHKRGTIRRPHFAHFSGNSNRACELYDPGNSLSNVGSWATASSASSASIYSVGGPVLVWRDNEPFSASLKLRLPAFNEGYASILTVTSELGRRRFQGSELLKPAFASVKLQVPPARFETSPRDPATEFRVNEAIDSFKFRGNFFRATAEGGILEKPCVPLELGETYFLLTQKQVEAPPESFKVLDFRNSLSWFAYRIQLRNDVNTRANDVRDLKQYLGRDILLPRPKVRISWPPPFQFDLDGVPIFDSATPQIYVRSTTGVPSFLIAECTAKLASAVGMNLYRLDFTEKSNSCAIWVPGGTIQEARFENCAVITPGAVLLIDEDGSSAPLISGSSFAPKSIEDKIVGIKVPAERMWKNIRIDGSRINPLPSGSILTVPGGFDSVDAGSFGNFFRVSLETTKNLEKERFQKYETLVVNSIGKSAWKALLVIRSKGQLIQWSLRYNGQFLLPIMLDVISTEVDCGIS